MMSRPSVPPPPALETVGEKLLVGTDLTGATTVSYEGKSITYRSSGELFAAITSIERDATGARAHGQELAAD
jgi:hypothetical protein